MLQAGHIITQGSGWFRFKHALLCDIAYETLLTPRRQKLHQRVAEALEAMPGNLAEQEPEALARHWFAAGQTTRGEVYWLRARHQIAHWAEPLDALADYLKEIRYNAIGAPVMHVVRGGDFSAAVELRRQFPGITDNVQARECARTIVSWKPLPVKPRPVIRNRAGDY